MNKISALNLVLWIGIGCHHAAFAQTSADISKLSSKNKTVQSKQNPSQTVVLGQVITASQFRKITEYSTSKASRNPIDFCVGVIDDDEQAMSLEGLSYRPNITISMRLIKSFLQVKLKILKLPMLQ